MTFFMAGKNKEDLTRTNIEIYRHLDGQLSLDDFLDDFNQSVRARFWKDNPPERPEKPSEGV